MQIFLSRRRYSSECSVFSFPIGTRIQRHSFISTKEKSLLDSSTPLRYAQNDKLGITLLTPLKKLKGLF